MQASPGDFGEGCAQHESTQPPNTGFEGGQGSSGRSGLSRGGPGRFQGGVYGGVQECWGQSGQNTKNTKKARKQARGSGGVQRFWAEKRLKTRKIRKTLRNCMAQDFVQEVPVGQIAQGTPFRCLPCPTQMSNTPPKIWQDSFVFSCAKTRKSDRTPPICPWHRIV